MVSEATTVSGASHPAIRDDFQEIASQEEIKAFWAKVGSTKAILSERLLSADISWLLLGRCSWFSGLWV
jgi:hypothetical protein